MTTHSASNTIRRFRVEGPGHNQALIITSGSSRHEESRLALIPEATVITGDRLEGRRIADDLNSRDPLQDGDVIWISGYGAEAYLAKRRPLNNDWWDLIPVGILRRGERYYAEYKGHFIWQIRDAKNEGEVVEQTSHGLQAAKDIASTMNVAMKDKPGHWEYMAAIGENKMDR